MSLNFICIIFTTAVFSTCFGISLESRLEKIDSAIIEKDEKNVLLEKAMLQRDKRMDLLENALLQKDQRMDLLEKVLFQRDEKIQQFENQMALMQEHLRTMESQLSEFSLARDQEQSKLKVNNRNMDFDINLNNTKEIEDPELKTTGENGLPVLKRQLSMRKHKSMVQSERNVNEKTISQLINTSKEVEETDFSGGDTVVPVLKREMKKNKRATPPVSTTIAFHAYLSKSHAYNGGETITFDVVPLDIGNNYNKGDGIYTVPMTGVYVVTWTIASAWNTYQKASLVINGSTIGLAVADSSHVYDIHQGTGIVVVHVNKGDHVLIRIEANNGGDVRSNSYTRTTFSGWLLSPV